MNFVDVTQPKKQPRRRKRIAIYEQEERREAVAYIPDEDTPVRKWTTFSRARTNEKRPRKRNRLKPRKKKTR